MLREKFHGLLTNVLTIDPGLLGTGYAFWESLPTYNYHVQQGVTYPKAFYPYKTGSIYIPDKISLEDSFIQRSMQYSYEIIRVLQVNLNITELDTIVIEFPQIWQTGKSMASALDGKLFKLVFLIGVLCKTFNGYNKINAFIPKIVTVFPNEWKGQLPKEIVINRIKKQLPSLERIGNHEGDAIGMGLAIQGLLES